MSIRPILTAENPLLRQKAKKVTHFGDALRNLGADLFATLRAVHGLGLAAPQIGISQRVFVVEVAAEYDEDGKEISSAESYLLVNPEIVKSWGEEEMEEGCLSVPGYRGAVKRATTVTIKGQDLHGKPVRFRGEDVLAQVFQHELDHLNGILYLDRLESADKLWRLQPRQPAEEQEEAAE